VLRGREIVRIPALMDKGVTAEGDGRAGDELARNAIVLRPAKPPWYQTAPSMILLKIGGRAFSAMASEHVEYRRHRSWRSRSFRTRPSWPEGPSRSAAPALSARKSTGQADHPDLRRNAREIEAHAKRVWAIYCEQPRAHRDASVLLERVTQLAAELSRQNLPWDEWQIIYRLLLQVDRALRGEEPLLEHAQRMEERDMAEEKLPLPGPRNVAKLPARQSLQTAVPARCRTCRSELIGQVIDSATQLAKKEIELAKSELRSDIKAELTMAKGLGVAGLCASGRWG